MRFALLAALLAWTAGLAACAGAASDRVSPTSRPQATPTESAPQTPGANACEGEPTFLEGTPIPYQNPKSGQVIEANEFCGTVTIDGAPAPDQTVIEAVVEGAVCGSGHTEGSLYYFAVPEGLCGSSGQTVFFLAGTGGDLAAESGQLVHPVGEHSLDLTVETEPATPRPAPEPFTFQGSVTVDGEQAADGTLVEIVGGCGLGLTGAGRYAIRGYPNDYGLGGNCGCGSIARFAVNGRPANEEGNIGCPGGPGKVNLTVGD
jgi:hypothetical protein